MKLRGWMESASKREATAELKRAFIGTRWTLLCVWERETRCSVNVFCWVQSRLCALPSSPLCICFIFCFCVTQLWSLCIHLWEQKRTKQRIRFWMRKKPSGSSLFSISLIWHKILLLWSNIPCTEQSVFLTFGPSMEYQFWLWQHLSLPTLDPNMLDTNHCLHIDTSSFEDQPIQNDQDKMSVSLDCDRHAYHSLKEGGPYCFYAFIEYKHPPGVHPNEYLEFNFIICSSWVLTHQTWLF